MAAAIAPRPQTLEIAYLRDTLLGVLTRTEECQVQLEALNIAGKPGVQLQITPPVPDRLERAHTLVFTWRGHQCRGIVQSARQCQDGSLQLRLELQ
ncbi:hypothetical protein [Pseudomonas putida]|uniref:PilZ domain-containing protein n=1 Tax=Pseudomonas putida TaxID=303 RepID=A0A177SCU9_PSEPU|nr:hypothetical protein [Pseudomonas putida]OAI84820.1 hypothetical protein AYO28_02755 [Pseudomonas putida]